MKAFFTLPGILTRCGSTLLLAFFLLNPAAETAPVTVIADFEGGSPNVLFSPLDLHGWTIVNGSRSELGIRKGGLEFCDSIPNRAAGWSGSASRPAGFPEAEKAGFFLQCDFSPGSLGVTGVAPATGALNDPDLGPFFGAVGGHNGTGSFTVHQSTSTNITGGGQLRLVIDPAGNDGDGAGYLFIRQFPDAIRCGVTFGGNGRNEFVPIPDLQNVPLGFLRSGTPAPSRWNAIFLQTADFGLLDNIVTGRVPMLRLRAIEVTQSIQDWNNSIPLIEGKGTFARVYLEAADPSDAGNPVSGRLRAFRNEVELPGPPLLPTTDAPFQNPASLPANAASARGDSEVEARSVLAFILPPEWSTGVVDFRFEPDGEAVLSTMEPAGAGESADGMVRVRFQPSATPQIIVRPVRIRRPSGALTPGPTRATMGRILENMQAMYPVSRFDINYGPPIQVRGSAQGVTGDQLTIGLFNAWRLMSNPGGRPMLGLVESSDLVPTETTTGQRIRGTDAAWALTDYSSTSAHEFGHILGLPHAIRASRGTVVEDGIEYLQGYCKELAPSPAPDFENFFVVPDPSTFSSETRPTLGPLDRGENAKIFGLENQNNFFFSKNPSNVFELMSYCGTDRWVSDRTYNRLRERINSRWAGSMAPNFALVQTVVQNKASAGSSPYVLFRGSVQIGNAAVEWFPTQVFETATPPLLPTPGDHILHLFDGAGVLLESVPFALPLPDDFELGVGPRRAPFAVSMPFHPSARRVELQRAGTLLGAMNASTQVPQVQALSPNGGEIFNGAEFEIRWTGADEDGDPLFYTVEYSSDNGDTWNTLASDLSVTNLVIRRDEISSGAQARVRILASDGFYCVSDESDNAFAVADKGPDIFVNSPTDGVSFHGQASVVFRAMAIDMEEGQLPGTNLVWQSDRDGLLGTGEDLLVNAWGLAEGPHLITLSASDNAGNTTVVSNTIHISHFVLPRLRVTPLLTNDTVRVDVIGNKPSLSLLEVSSNLVDWVPWQSVAQTSLSQTVLDTIERGKPMQYYRARTVPLPTTVITQPASPASLAGGSVVLEADVQGQWLTYQWFFNGTAVTNATNATLVLSNVQSSQSGDYFLVASNAQGVVTTSTALVTILNSVMGQIHQFGTNSLDGINGWGPLILGSDNWLYGCARNGAINNGGVVFKLRTDGRDYTVLHRFQTASQGGVPLGGVIQGSDGKLYGTTSTGGTNNAGTIFSLGTNGTGFNVLHHFLSTNDCRNPQAELLEGSDGALYGTAYNGGGFGRGGLFKINKDGSGYTILSGFNFGGLEAPRAPLGGLVQGLDGFLYGTTEFGGLSNRGAIFRIDKAGTNAIVLKSFGLVANGAAHPGCTLLQASDGFIYGTTYSGGSSNLGAVFKISTDASFFAVIASFTPGSGNGLEPRVGLTEAPNGQLVGTTRIGGSSDMGVIFRINKNGSGYETLRSFNQGSNPGARPRSPLLRGPGGVFYGTTFGGGTNDQGVIFRYFLPELAR